MPCESYEGGLTICYSGPRKRIAHESQGEKWCFRCRKRREFFYEVWADVEPSYYDPNPSIKCGTCGLSDGDLFPGYERSWG